MTRAFAELRSSNPVVGVGGREAADALSQAGLIPPETRRFSLNLGVDNPKHIGLQFTMSAEWNASRGDVEDIAVLTIHGLVDKGVLPQGTFKYSLQSGEDEVTTLKAEWLLSTTTFFHVLSTLTRKGDIIE